jgi:transcriptional regulator with XRE-family HTH domain
MGKRVHNEEPPCAGCREVPPLAKALGHLIAERRRARGLTQEALARPCAIERGYLSSVERGTSGPSLRTLCCIARVLECSASRLLADAERLVRQDAAVR